MQSIRPTDTMLSTHIPNNSHILALILPLIFAIISGCDILQDQLDDQLIEGTCTLTCPGPVTITAENVQKGACTLALQNIKQDVSPQCTSNFSPYN